MLRSSSSTREGRAHGVPAPAPRRWRRARAGGA
jgi:hypothetical protein